MSSVDERVVRMQFENEAFKKKAQETQKSLADVNKAVDASGKSKGLLDLSSNMTKVSATASKMAIVTTTALATIANKATNAALNMAKSMTFDPIRDGFSEYESLLTKQNVIMNATGKSGKFVKGILNELNEYSDKTIYSFGNMTDAITKFVNAGVPLEQATVSIKGIANAAAFAGANSEEANRAMYAFSQSMSLGFIGLQDWNQIENANMGTMRFKNELLKAAEAAGTLKKSGDGYLTSTGKYVSASKGWRDGLQEQWATTEVLNKALGKYANENTKLGKKAMAAAQDVRTFTAFMDTLKESLGSGWAAIFKSLFGGVKRSTEFWTGLSDAVGGAVHRFFEFTQTTLKTWRKLGGFEKTIEGFRNLLSPFGALLKAVGEAWGEAFPNTDKGAGKTLYVMSSGFAAVTSPLRLLAKLITASTPGIKLFFQVLRIGWVVVREGAEWVGNLVSSLFGLIDLKAPGDGGFIGWVKNLASEVAGAADKVSDLLSKGKSLTEAFAGAGIKLPKMPDLPDLPVIGKLFGGSEKSESKVTELTAGVKDLSKSMFGLSDASEKVDKTAIFKKSGEVTKKSLSTASAGASSFVKDMKSASNVMADVGVKMGGTFEKLKEWWGNFVDGFSFTKLMEAFNMSLLATFTISIARLFNTFSKGFKGFAMLGDTLNETIGSIGNSFEGFAAAQKRAATAKVILAVAVAMGVLTLSLWLLSKIPIWDLMKSLLALNAVFAMLNRGVKSMTKLFATMQGQGLSASINMMAITAALIGLGFAMLLMAAALRVMEGVGLMTVVKQIALMAVMMKVLQKLGEQVDDQDWKQMAAAGVALVGMGFAMLLLAGALLIFQKIKWETLGKAGAALAGVTLALGALVALAKGPYGAAALAAAGLAMVGAATGMIALANALLLFGLVKWDAMKKAGVALAGLAGGLILLTVGIGGAGALSIASVGLIALATSLLFFNKVNWSSIAKLPVALAALALGLAILTPILFLAAPAMLLFGIGIGALGVGILAFATAMSIAIAMSGAAAVAFGILAIAAVQAIAIFLQSLAAQSQVMKQSILAIIQAVVDTMVEAVPIVIDGAKRLWESIKKEFQSENKKKDMEDSGKSWITRIGEAITKMVPDMVEQGSNILIAFLKGLEKKTKPITEAAVGVITKFIDGISGRSDEIIESGKGLLRTWLTAVPAMAGEIAISAGAAVVQFLNDLATALEDNSGPAGDAMARVVEAMFKLGSDLVSGLSRGIAAGIVKYNPVSQVVNLVGKMIKGGKKEADSHSPSRKMIELGQFMAQGLTIGVQNYAAAAIQAVASMVSGQIATATRYIDGFVQKLDQTSIAAMAKAQGLAEAADIAQTRASKTNGKKDDKRAEKLANQAAKAQRQADKAEERAQEARDAQDRADEYRDATTIDKAKMRSEDAQTRLDKAKQLEMDAAAALTAANALDEQAKKANKKQRKKLKQEADDLRADAKKYAERANAELEAARVNASDALALQMQAGREAAEMFQQQFDSEARTAADEEAFAKLSDAEKAKKRREDAANLQAQAEADLARAKELAYTDLEAANDLATQAMDQAQKARDYLKEAASYEGAGPVGSVSGGAGGAMGTVVNLEASEAAALAFNKYLDIYDSSVAAMAGERKVEFNQFNTSPEALSPTEIYRNTNNQLTFAEEQLNSAA